MPSATLVRHPGDLVSDHSTWVQHVRLLGAAGTNAPTKPADTGANFDVTRVSQGRIRLQFATGQAAPGAFMGVVGYTFEGATPANLARVSMVVEGYDAAASQLIFTMYASDGTTVRDLAVGETLTFSARFRRR